jgi:hypothetical protein
MADKPAETAEAKEKTPAVETAASTKPAESNRTTPVEMDRDNANLLYRFTEVTRSDIVGEDTFQIAAASEFPGKQIADEVHARVCGVKEGEPYTEILSHNEGDADLSFLNSGRAAFLDEHTPTRHLGNIKKATLSTDKVTRILAQCDEVTKLSKIRKKQLSKKSRMNVSMGYIHTRYLGSQTLDDGTVGHRFAWQGREVSSVADPLDTTVGLGRAAATDKVACFNCGKQMKSSDMIKSDDALYCSQDCVDAETPADDTERSVGLKMFRAKKDSKEFRISHAELRQKTVRALDSDKRFKYKRDNGDQVSDFYHHDNHQVSADGTDFQAIVSSPAWRDGSKLYAVDFTYDGSDVTLGEATHVEPKTTLEAVERGLPCDLKQFRSVDLPELSEADKTAIVAPNILTRKIMADKTPEQIAQEAIAAKPELVIDSLETPHVKRALAERGYRTKIELDAAAKTRDEKIAGRNKEILALETEFRSDAGDLINHRKLPDGRKEPFYVRDAIHLAAMEACASDDSKPDTEIRQIFRSKVDDLKRGAASEENIKRAVDAAEMGLAGRCDDVFAVIKRTLAESHSKGTQSRSLMPAGAELEYSDEIRNQFKSMPGCAHVADLGGFMSPPKQGRKWDGTILERKARSGSRMKRDALASDFVTVGAMIAPEFRPYIELLRNSTVLDKLGCTYIGGCNGEQVFPRQEAATVAQSVAEGSQLNPYDQTLGQIKMTPKRVGSRQYYSRLAVIQAVPGWEAMVWNDHAMVLAIYQDEMGINGTGAADQPTGILNQPGINQLLFGGTPTYNNILNFRTQIRKFNVPGQLAFTTTSVGQGRLAYLPAALNGSTVITQGELDAIWKGDEENGEMLGCKAVASQQIPGDILLAGVFSELLMASWGGIFTTLDNYTRADRDEVAITFNTYFDIAVRHAQAFTRSLDTVNQ